MFRTAFAIAALMFTGTAAANDVVGTWEDGAVALEISEDGRFDWSVGRVATDGEWSIEPGLVSLRTTRGERTYAYTVDGDVLTLFEADGTRVELVREGHKRKRARRRTL